MSRREYLDSVVDDGAQNLGQKPIYEKENSEWYLKQQKREGDKKKTIPLSFRRIHNI